MAAWYSASDTTPSSSAPPFPPFPFPFPFPFALDLVVVDPGVDPGARAGSPAGLGLSALAAADTDSPTSRMSRARDISLAMLSCCVRRRRTMFSSAAFFIAGDLIPTPPATDRPPGLAIVGDLIPPASSLDVFVAPVSLSRADGDGIDVDTADVKAATSLSSMLLR